MATGKALNGKPYAGNPHVRFDEGEVASAATPRRGSLLYKKHQGKLVALFDLDGTLVNTDSANSAAYRVALAQNGMGNILGLYGRITSSTVRNLGCGMDRIDSIVNAKVSAYCHELWRTRLGPAADALQCVIVNRDVFEKIVCLTDSAEQRAAETLRYWSLDGFFDEIVCNGGRGDKYANYFKAFDSDPAACVVWENEEGQIKSAIAAGVKMDNIRKVR